MGETVRDNGDVTATFSDRLAVGWQAAKWAMPSHDTELKLFWPTSYRTQVSLQRLTDIRPRFLGLVG